MAAQFTRFSKADFEHFLGVDSATGRPVPGGKGFYRIKVQGTWEYVYSKLVDPEQNFSLRIMSTVDMNTNYAREKGVDAIRVLLFWRADEKSQPVAVGTGKDVRRTQNWRDSLEERIDMWDDMVGPTCKCGAPTCRKLRRSDNKPFFGCVKWPNCPKANEKEDETPETGDEVDTAVVETPPKPMPVPTTVIETVKTPVKMEKGEDGRYSQITRSQLAYLIMSALVDPKVQMASVIAAGNALYNEGAFILRDDGKIDMHPDAERWLPQGE